MTGEKIGTCCVMNGSIRCNLNDPALSAALVGVAGAHRYRAGFGSLAAKRQVRLRSNLGGTAEIMLRPYF